ncbi:MAG: type VI secretion system baseplate subunit TssK [Blastocatellia bacterium]|nr:type VI secretion system baseplate subunit TssK [Blastocatellia bacterium]
MSLARKITWLEGSRITPHHFQQWDNYLEDQLVSRVRALGPFNWGVAELEINRDGVSNGQFALTRCKAILPDGMYCDMPGGEPCPPPLDLAKAFEGTAEKLDVFLAVPAKRSGMVAFHIPGRNQGQHARFVQVPGTAIDETTGENEMQLPFAVGNFRFLVGNQVREGFSALKVAEVVRSTTGQFQLNDNFLPPLLNVGASLWLHNNLRQLVEILATKCTTLSESRRQSNSSLVDFTSMEAAAFWLLHTVNTALPALKHLYAAARLHPEPLYRELAQLEGQLMTFAVNRHPRDIVEYQHENLFVTFYRLFSEIRELLDVVISNKCVQIPLVNVRESVYKGVVEDDRLLHEAAFFLAVRSNSPDRDVMSRVPRVVKIASFDHIDRVVGAAMPGVVLNHMMAPPGAIPVRPGYHYFSLETVGKFWEVIRGAKSMGVYIPDEFPNVKVEMYAVKP